MLVKLSVYDNSESLEWEGHADLEAIPRVGDEVYLEPLQGEFRVTDTTWFPLGGGAHKISVPYVWVSLENT